MESSNVDFLKVFNASASIYFNWKAQNSPFIPNISPNFCYRMILSVTFFGSSLAAPMLSFF